jgi:hypothetical protein
MQNRGRTVRVEILETSGEELVRERVVLAL